MSKDYYDYLRADTQGVMSGPETSEQATQFRLVGKLLKEFFGGVDDG